MNTNITHPNRSVVTIDTQGNMIEKLSKISSLLYEVLFEAALVVQINENFELVSTLFPPGEHLDLCELC